MGNTILFKKSTIAFQLLLIALFRWTTITCRFNLYNTDQAIKHNDLQFDCLDYHVYGGKLAYQELRDLTNEVIPYCFRPANHVDEFLIEASLNPLSQSLSFQELRMANSTSQELLLWSVSISVTEQYQLYLNEPKLSLNMYFYNCTEPWFGLLCQYSFEFDEQMSFDKIVNTTFHGRTSYIKSSDITVQVPCYALLKYHRNGQVWCLDWCEVCDGILDCFDEGIDEESCFDMEINECEDNEYRCHNGLCISDKLWQEGEGDADCLDRSDELQFVSYPDFCFQDPTFRCEEHTCRRNLKRFSCGDGQCVNQFTDCHNGRHDLLIDLMTTKSNLKDECWIAMVCLTKLRKQVNGTSCETWLMNNSTYELLKQCDPFFQFPTIPVYSGHVRFFYENVYLRPISDDSFLPDYVCYDQQLCHWITPQLVHENLTCLQDHKSTLYWGTPQSYWTFIMGAIEYYFDSCLIPSFIFHNKTNYSNHPSLYNCQNSTKWISKYRILDEIQDCYNNDDEVYQSSCLLNHRYRVKRCDRKNCWSPLLKSDNCIFNDVKIEKEIPFESFCDGMAVYNFINNNEEILTDEAECKFAWCDNIYARCDGFWSCSDGRDEVNCRRTECPLETLACVFPLNYSVICLPKERVRDNISDCFGATDEQNECRQIYNSINKSMRLQCLNTSICIKPSQLCDGQKDCMYGDDEDICNTHQITCEKSSSHNYSEVELILCGLNEGENRKYLYFSVHTLTNHPLLEKSIINEMTPWSINQGPVVNVNVSQVKNKLWPWYCNRGLVVHTWNKNNNYTKTCMCPPSYYGNQCQYQNQRISLTLQLTAVDKLATYAIVIMLIDDDDEHQEINAYDQFIYIVKQSCSIKFNRYLLFSTRPKNFSKSYAVRIDAFKKNEMKYVGSWHFSIDFLFLPVNRLAVTLEILNQPIQTLSNCTNTCKNGECIKYLNKEKYFCRCHSGWSGIQCNIPMNCHSCLSSSICIGSSKNQSICVCPLERFGPRCLLQSTCPINACQNNGQCVPADVSIPGSDYTCICSDEFFGPNCQFSKAKVDVSLNNIHVTSHLIAYFFTLSNESHPINTIILRKLTLFQYIVTFHISMPYHMMIIEINKKYYLAVLQQFPRIDILTSISPAQECIPTEQLINSTILQKHPYERIVSYYALCGERHDLTCFVDENFLCLCTNDHHANCLTFNRYKDFQCPLKNYCKNEAKCLQDHPSCPSTRICVCPKCFFGNQCQFYAKGLGSTLDEILGYEFKNNIMLSKQPFTVKMSAIITMLICIIGIINGILSIITFLRKQTREVGCGIYLLASSITSLLTMALFTVKFWFLFLSHQDILSENGQNIILHANCMVIEPVLKISLYIDNWFNACVAMERTVSVFQGISFNKNKSKRVAISIVIILPFIMTGLFIPQLINLRLFEDQIEKRSWCVIIYSPWLQKYSLTLIFFHYFAPLFINIFSALFIIIANARQRASSKTDHTFWTHIIFKLKQYKHLIISPTIIIILTLPHLIISIILDCNKSSNLFWFYLIGYFLSFIPAALVFIIFILPSTLYKQEFKKIIFPAQQHFDVLKFIPTKF
ncbi:unnamed protein product [Rotaria sp. Silwood2]|nr:unnamed protein product [Rotaria sp. Silwood2]